MTAPIRTRKDLVKDHHAAWPALGRHGDVECEARNSLVADEQVLFMLPAAVLESDLRGGLPVDLSERDPLQDEVFHAPRTMEVVVVGIGRERPSTCRQRVGEFGKPPQILGRVDDTVDDTVGQTHRRIEVYVFHTALTSGIVQTRPMRDIYGTIFIESSTA
ncbi:hypothetical protein ACFQVD_31045 [Streptosporangium amethystogenes subsp. fukuiense]|uniref:Uncharacterized protein n=1 Tax=Streptosporangium amethystogenes subsp. fukuiense TaxID=698418 RepID=A0ABW2T793_9ACTN